MVLNVLEKALRWSFLVVALVFLGAFRHHLVARADIVAALHNPVCRYGILALVLGYVALRFHLWLHEDDDADCCRKKDEHAS